MLPPQQQHSRKRIGCTCIVLIALVVMALYLPIYFNPVQELPLIQAWNIEKAVIRSGDDSNIDMTLTVTFNLSSRAPHSKQFEHIDFTLYDESSDCVIGRLMSRKPLDFISHLKFNVSASLYVEQETSGLRNLLKCFFQYQSCLVCE